MVIACQNLRQFRASVVKFDGFCADAKDEVVNIVLLLALWGSFALLTADLTPGVKGKKVQAGADEEYQHHDSIPEEVLKLLKPMAVYVGLSEKSLLDMDVSEEQCKIKTRQSMG